MPGLNAKVSVSEGKLLEWWRKRHGITDGVHTDLGTVVKIILRSEFPDGFLREIDEKASKFGVTFADPDESFYVTLIRSRKSGGTNLKLTYYKESQLNRFLAHLRNCNGIRE